MFQKQIEGILNLAKTKKGRIVLSIIWGLGIAFLFRKICIKNNCVKIIGPSHKKDMSKSYFHDNRCYKFSVKKESCTEKKRIIDYNT